jgi:Gram-negative porin
MKKTLLALAVVAASGAAFAQSATLSGSYVFGYQSTKSAAGVKTAGLGTDTAAISLVATEDLGGGLKATAKVSLGGMMRDGAGTGEDASLVLSGGFGSILLGTIESDDGLSRAYAGAPVIGLDGKVHGGNANIDVIGYTTPQLAPGLTAGISYVDRGAAASAADAKTFTPAKAAVGTGLGLGTTGATGAQPSATVNLTYGAGPVSARFDVTSWTRKGAADVSSAANKNRFRISGNYNLGMAKIGLGYASLKRTTTDITQLEAGVSAAFGATTVGAVYEQQKVGTVKTTGFTVGAQYNLSKRTNVSAGYAQWKTAGASSANTFRVLVGHSF